MYKKPLRIVAVLAVVLVLSAAIVYISSYEFFGGKFSLGQDSYNLAEKSDDSFSELESLPEQSEGDSETENSVQSAGDSVSKAQNPETDLSVIDDYENKYFIKKLSDENKYYFCEIYKAVLEHKDYVTFDIPIYEDELSVLMYILNYDCPELIHLKGDYFLENTGDGAKYVSKLKLQYCMTEDEYISAVNELDKFFGQLVSDLNGMEEYEKEKYVYDYIFNLCHYDELSELGGSAYASLIKGFGRCESFSKAFMWCMRKLGIECICVSGSQNWDEDSMYTEHSWNIVNIDGNWYHVDITVDNVNLGTDSHNSANYGFFNVDDSFVKESHVIDGFYTELGIPVCTHSERNYHKMNNQLIASGDAENKLKDIMLAHFDGEGIDNLSIKFESKTDYEEILDNMKTLMTEFLEGNSDDIFEYNSCYNNLSRTIIINLKKKDISEGE